MAMLAIYEADSVRLLGLLVALIELTHPRRARGHRNVRYWHKADITSYTAHVRFRG